MHESGQHQTDQKRVESHSSRLQWPWILHDDQSCEKTQRSADQAARGEVEVVDKGGHNDQDARNGIVEEDGGAEKAKIPV